MRKSYLFLPRVDCETAIIVGEVGAVGLPRR